MRPRARWYVDADTTGLGKILALARSDVTFVGDDGQRGGNASHWLPASPVQDAETPDEEWIRAVAQQGMVAITRDIKILSRLNEINAIRANHARVFAISPSATLDKWGLLEVVVAQWRAMEEIAIIEPGPWVYFITRTGKPVRRFPT